MQKKVGIYMVCPKDDKLFDYIEGILEDNEKDLMERHIQSCPYCEQQLELLLKENELLEQTLKSPILPDDFAEKIVDQLEPHKRKKNRPLKWVLGTAASALLAGGVFMSVSPSVAKLVGGIFSSETVDEGLRMAIDTDIATPVNLSATDADITLHIEDLIADTSRIAFSYRVTNQQGKVLNPFIGDADLYSIKVLDEHQNEVELNSMSWGLHDDYGIYEISLVNIDNFTKGTVRLDIHHLAGKDGQWQIDIPIDLTSAYEQQKVVALNESYEVEGVKIHLDKVNYATSTTDIYYQLEYTEEVKERLKQQLKQKELQFNNEIVQFLYFPSIGYRIENGKGVVLGYENIYFSKERGHPVSENMLSGMGQWDGEPSELGPYKQIDSFVPNKNAEEELYFVVDTIYRPKISEFSITFNPKELPKTFEYNGYELTIDSVQEKTDYSLQKSWMPIQRQKSVEIQLSGFALQKAPNIEKWALEDEKGNKYTIHHGGSTLDETDQQGRFKRTFELVSSELEEIPEEMTLHIIAETEVIPLKNEIRIPLFKN